MWRKAALNPTKQQHKQNNNGRGRPPTKSYEEIIRATAALDWRIRTHMPENYMEEIFGQTPESDPSLYNRLWRAMRTGSIQFLLDTLDYTNEKKLIRYISQKA